VLTVANLNGNDVEHRIGTAGDRTRSVARVTRAGSSLLPARPR